MMNKMARSKCAIELQNPGQTGLTTRPIESILTKTKIITTNKYIVNYSLYDPNNILIIDENNPNIDNDWLNSSYKELSADIKDFYSLSRFIDTLIL